MEDNRDGATTRPVMSLVCLENEEQERYDQQEYGDYDEQYRQPSADDPDA